LFQQVLELRKEKKCIAHPVDQLDTGKYAVMNMSVQSILTGLYYKCGLVTVHYYFRKETI